MNTEIQILKNLVKGMSVEEGVEAINKHYEQIVWSMEKDEWENKMSMDDKISLVQIIQK